MGGSGTHDSGDLERDLFDDDDDREYGSGSEEAVRLVENEPSRPRKISQKKKIEQANFAKWFDNNQTALTKKAAKKSSAQEHSLAYMVKSWEGGEKIITSPRDYQLELFERAKKENTIAVLDTGKSSRIHKTTSVRAQH